MKKQPLVSVIIPAYNHEKYIQYTIESIINQTYQNIELLIIDDGSKDSTYQKMQEMKKECEKRFVCVYFETKENEGTCKTYNKLFKRIKGEYVFFIDSDDMAKPNAIEKGINFLEKNPNYALVVGDNEIIDSENKVCFWDKDRNIVYENKRAVYKSFGDFLKHCNKNINFNSKEFGTYDTLIFGNYIPNGYLIRKSILNNFKFTPEAPLEDWNLMLHISKYGKMKFFDEILFSYRWHANNTIKQREKMIAITKKTLKYELALLKNLDFSKCLKNVELAIHKEIKYKTFGIPYILTLEKFKNIYGKLCKIKIFNFTILRWKKY